MTNSSCHFSTEDLKYFNLREYLSEIFQGSVYELSVFTCVYNKGSHGGVSLFFF